MTDDKHVVWRLFSLFGFGGTFLMISPKLRGIVTGSIGSLTKEMELYSPFSYIGAALLLLLTLMISMYRGAQPR